METPVEKNKEYIVQIIDNGFEGEGIAKVGGFTVFVPNVIKGEKVRIVVVKVLASHAFGKALEVIEKAESRRDVDCVSYKRCGGCNLRHMSYESTLVLKRDIVQNLVNKTLLEKLRVNETVGMENPFYYRNKAIFPIRRNVEGKAVYGVFASRSHDVVEFDECMIQSKVAQDVAEFVVRFVNENDVSVYDESTLKGSLRHVVVKYGMSSGEVMCVLVVNGDKLEKEAELARALVSKFSCVKSVVKNVNSKNTNVILGDKDVVLYGADTICDKLR